MTQHIASITLVVRDYDEAIAFFCETLGFDLVEDTDLGGGKRWILVAPTGSPGARLLLAKAEGDRQAARVGNQTGGRVSLFLHTDDFWRDYRAYGDRGVRFREQPRDEPYGTVVVFEDLYGNLWDLVQPGIDAQKGPQCHGFEARHMSCAELRKLTDTRILQSVSL